MPDIRPILAGFGTLRDLVSDMRAYWNSTYIADVVRHLRASPS